MFRNAEQAKDARVGFRAGGSALHQGTCTVGCRRGSGGGSVGIRAPTEAPVVRVEELKYVDTPEMFYCKC